MGKRMLRILAGLTGMSTVITSALGAGLPPRFTQRSPESVLVNLNAGQNSFECTGTAIDLDVNDIVYIASAPLPSFMRLEHHDGNPATFRLHAENLTGASYGGYLIDVLCTDDLSHIDGDSASFAIQIFPEPSTMAGVVALTMFTSRRCARR